jgi:hypothetical protein
MSEKTSFLAKIRRAGLAGAVLSVMAAAAMPAMAGSGGNVMPSNAKPKGYSLTDAAAAIAVFDTGPRGAAQPNVPFYVLRQDATVKPGTTIYVPVYHADDSGIVEGEFPADVTDQQADAAYLDSLLFNDFGVQALIIVVDGKVTVLDDSYIHGTPTAPLLDGPPAGTNFIISGAFLTPLTPGQHTVDIGGIIDGEPVVFRENTVTVGK